MVLFMVSVLFNIGCIEVGDLFFLVFTFMWNLMFTDLEEVNVFDSRKD